jgi:hypothetical protein
LLGFRGVGHAIEAAPEFDDSTVITKGVKSVGVDSERDDIASQSKVREIAGD